VAALRCCAGFEVTSLIELPPPGGIIALWAVVLPALYLLSTSITNLVLRDHTILKGPCPNCGTDNFTYFGDIFTGAWVAWGLKIWGLWAAIWVCWFAETRALLCSAG
jgi:hypothetical protein